jgi:hypothetical protein
LAIACPLSGTACAVAESAIPVAKAIAKAAERAAPAGVSHRLILLVMMQSSPC